MFFSVYHVGSDSWNCKTKVSETVKLCLNFVTRNAAPSWSYFFLLFRGKSLEIEEVKVLFDILVKS